MQEHWRDSHFELVRLMRPISFRRVALSRGDFWSLRAQNPTVLRVPVQSRNALGPRVATHQRHRGPIRCAGSFNSARARWWLPPSTTCFRGSVRRTARSRLQGITTRAQAGDEMPIDLMDPLQVDSMVARRTRRPLRREGAAFLCYARIGAACGEHKRFACTITAKPRAPRIHPGRWVQLGEGRLGSSLIVTTAREWARRSGGRTRHASDNVQPAVAPPARSDDAVPTAPAQGTHNSFGTTTYEWFVAIRATLRDAVAAGTCRAHTRDYAV